MFQQKFFRALFLLAFSPCVTFALENNPQNLLADVISGFSTESYNASVVYIRPSGMESVDIEYDRGLKKVTFNTGLEKQTVQTTLANQETVKVGNNTISHRNKYMFNSLASLHSNLDVGLKSYDLFISEYYDQVAGRSTSRLSVIAKTNDRYSYVHWVDADTKIILRTDTLNENGELIERMMSTAFTLKESKAVTSKLELEANSSASYSHVQGLKGQQTSIKVMPLGFYILSEQSIYSVDKTLLYERIILTDGFASIDIYRGESNHKVKMTRGQQLDAFHIYKKNIQGSKVSFEGRLPLVMLEKIAANLIFEDQHD
ncbi:MAG: hypothetical protein A6F70_04455 [Cycloclasticus sp. symbiont of Bathymodiolus heckerae]|nr:MAG: hypothetical protein A6F70_04455 [Cycloclasticus sp. symbiont of Bathymodiolus heckerae]